VVKSDSLYGNHSGSNWAVYTQVDKRFNRLTLSLGLRGEYFKLNDEVNTSDINLLYISSIRNERRVKAIYDTETQYYRQLDIQRDSVKLVEASKIKPVLRFGINYQLAEYSFIRASYGQGYRYPTVAEKFVQTNAGSLAVFPNPQLRPEYGTSAEIGIKQGIKIGNWNGFVDVAGFWTEYRDMMEFNFGIWFPDTASPDYQQFVVNKLKYLGFKSVNVSNARITGVDISVTGTGKVGPVNLTVFGGYNYTKPINLNYDYFDSLNLAGPRFLKYRFFHLWKGDVQLDYKKFSTGMSVRYNSFMINIDESFEENILTYIFNNPGNAEVFILPGLREYRQIHRGGNLIFDYRFGYDISEKTRISLIINNLLNAENMGRPGDLMAPRAFMMQYVFKI
jgi:outer membrane receptor protein involved in Fe transport